MRRIVHLRGRADCRGVLQFRCAVRCSAIIWFGSDRSLQRNVPNRRSPACVGLRPAGGFPRGWLYAGESSALCHAGSDSIREAPPYA